MGPIHPSLDLPPALAIGISPLTAHVLSLLFTSSYVGSIYISQTLLAGRSKRNAVQPRGGNPAIPPISATDRDGMPELPEVGSRDHPDTVRLRMKAVGIATAASILGVWWLIKDVGGYTATQAIQPALSLLGLPTALPSSFSPLPLLLAPTLMFGPLVANYFDGDLPLQRPSSESTWTRIKRSFSSLTVLDVRNYIVAPVTEELAFRSTVLAVSLLAHLPQKTLVFLTPLYFGLAHAHHAVESWKKNGRTTQAAVHASAACVFQLGYTTLFGWFASYLYLRTGSVVPPILSHVFCNLMGIYLPTTAIARHPQRKNLIWGAYLAGIAGFIYELRTL